MVTQPVEDSGATAPTENSGGATSAAAAEPAYDLDAPVGDQADYPTTAAWTGRQDQVRWGAVWAGVTTTLAAFVFLVLAFFAFGWLTLGGTGGAPAGAPTSMYLMTGLVGLLAFLAGGAMAGATSTRPRGNSGLLHGALVWTLGITLLLVLTQQGGVTLFGAFSDALARITVIQNAVNQGQGNIPAQALTEARQTIGYAVAALAAFLIASVVGGMLGSKLWPRRAGEGAGTRS